MLNEIQYVIFPCKIHMFDIETLLLEQIVYEARFKGGYLYWDNCGKIWSRLASKFTGLDMETISTKEAKLTIKNERLNISFSHERLSITQEYPSNLKLFSEISDTTFESVTDLLEIETLTRIGNRFFYILQVSDSNESLKYMKNLGCFSDLDKKTEKFGEIIKDPQIKFTINKGEEKGYIVNVHHQERELTITLPKFVKYDDSQFLSKVLKIDVDFFTIKPVDCSIVKSSELIQKNSREIKYLIKELFG